MPPNPVDIADYRCPTLAGFADKPIKGDFLELVSPEILQEFVDHLGH